MTITSIFTLIGRAVAWTNKLVADQNSIYLAASTGMADNILSQFNSNRNLVPNVQLQVQGFALAMAGQAAAAKAISDSVLSSLQGQLNAPNAQPATILPLLSASMAAGGYYITPNVPTAPSISAGGANTTTDVLVASNLNNAGVTDQRSIAETVVFTCARSQYTGATAGAETFQIVGQPGSSPYVYGPLGNGTGSTQVIDSRNVASNGNFETWTVANTPDNWTTTGTIGTNILQNTANPHSGGSCLEFKGDSSTATIKVTQVIASQMRSATLYTASIWLRKSGTVAGGSTLAVTITGTGFTTKTLFSADPSTLTTSYAQYVIWFAMPTNAGNSVPADLSMNVSWTGAGSETSAAVLLIDDFVLATPTFFGNVAYAIFRGSVDPVVGDNYTVTTAITSAGVFQTFFSQFYNQQLQSSGSTLINDSLAT